VTYSYQDHVVPLLVDSSFGHGLTNQTSIGGYCRWIPLPLPSDIKTGDKICVGYVGYSTSSGYPVFSLGEANISGTGTGSGEYTALTTGVTANTGTALGPTSDRQNEYVELAITDEIVTHVAGGATIMITWHMSHASGYIYVENPVVYLRRT